MMPPELPQKGNLRQHPLSGILTLIQRQRLSGTLTLKHNDRIKSIYVREGQMIFATSQVPDDRLGEFLLKTGKIGLKGYEESTREVIRTGKRHGAVLVQLGFLAPKDLVWGVSNQVQEIILSLFTWEDGEFHFEKDVFPTQEVITLKISTDQLIFEGVRRIGEWGRLRQALPGLESVPVLTEDPLAQLQNLPLDEAAKKTVTLVNGKRTLAGFFDDSYLSPFDTLKLMYYLVSTDAVRFPDDRPPAEAVSSSAAEAPSGETSEGSKEEDLSPEENRDRILQAFDQVGRKTHYEVLGVSATDSPAAIKKAYFALSKSYHPDRHIGEGMSELKPKLETLFHRITEAYKTLTNEESRKKYDFEISTDKIHGGRGEEKPRPSVDEMIARGKLALKNGETKTAIYFFEQAVKTVPDKAVHHSLLGEALSQIKMRQREAEKHYLEAVRIDPSNFENYVALGGLYEKAGLIQRALQQFEKALSWDPDNSSIKARIQDLKGRKDT